MLYIYPKGSINKFETLELFSSWYQSQVNLGFLTSKIVHSHQSSASSTTAPPDLRLTVASPAGAPPGSYRGSTSELQGLRQPCRGSTSDLVVLPLPGELRLLVLARLSTAGAPPPGASLFQNLRSTVARGLL
jgi:hypothetical protein